ncbi:MAG: FAD-dependent oxidoreductase [Actinomyces urogenitalis]|uniref:FAD-dependent oxidoreductase n=1 Tax=Actinomyces urogenitalis TaxID=103621 RepID=UPI002A80267E|nr:FAD-dependent oxidoreductase [Actinomyces urogenitalis]MDY3678396.1 FAD-dependent oxidoreductase [Actinomyces urogenitalis]
MTSQITQTSDLVVIGGGLAGCCAAIAAARQGLSVSLVTNRPVLGGNSSSEVRVWVVGATAHGTQRFARETGIMGELFLENQYRNPEGNVIYWDQVLLDAVRAEPGISLHLNTDVHEVRTSADGTRIESVSGWAMQTETWYTFTGSVFADCTGDGLVGALAGASYMLGREGAEDFSEEWAPPVADRQLLGSSMFFYSKDTGKPQKFVAPNCAVNIEDTPIPRNRIIRTGDNGCHYWWIEWGGHLDIVGDADRIRAELESVIYGVWDYIKNSGNFDADTLTLEWVGTIPGRREYRRFVGDHVLTQNDLMEQVEFDDAVAYGGWSIDLHPVEGMYASDPGARQRYSDGPYQIPFRSLYSKDLSNMLMAGRDISATHVAEGSARVMATCATQGEAVGTAASLMVRQNLTARQLAERAGRLQQLLLREDASVLGVARQDPDDLLAGATVRASSWQRQVATGSFLPPAADLPQGARPSHLGAPVLASMPMDHDLAVVLPVDPRLDRVDLLVDADAPTELEAELWTTGKPQNYVPKDLVRTVSVQVPHAADAVTVSIDLDWQPEEPANAVLVLRRNPHLAVALTNRYPYGLMLLERRGEDGPAFDARIPDEPGQLLTTWVARDHRGTVPVLAAYPATAAWAPERALDAYQRPYGGPHMWVSALDDGAARPCPDGELEEWIELEMVQPRTVASIRLVFNDDVDADLINLHHHSTDWEVAPTLVRDYRLEGRMAGPGGQWVTLARGENNRHRHAIHDVAPLVLDALRLVVTRTGGAPFASLSAIKAYEAPSGRAPRPWR